jgi:hypothetical protein
MKTAEPIDLLVMYSVHDFAREKFGFLRFGHFASRRNKSACSAEVLRINFLALSMDIVRTGRSARGGAGVMIVSFSMELLRFQFCRSWAWPITSYK